MNNEQPMLEQTGLLSTQQFDATIRLIQPEFILKIQAAEDKELIRILPSGDIVAENLENASEAGKLFIESMRMNGKPLLERIHELETENEKLKSELYEMRKSDQVF